MRDASCLFQGQVIGIQTYSIIKRRNSMITRRLGRTGFEVSALGLGCFQFTGEYDIHPDLSEELMDFAMESPINIFDTASMYGFGESEEIVARGAFKHPDKRCYVSTKIGYLHDRTVTRAKGYAAYQDPKEIKRAVKHSLWISRKEQLDMCMIHEPDWDCWGFDYETGEISSLYLNAGKSLTSFWILGMRYRQILEGSCRRFMTCQMSWGWTCLNWLSAIFWLLMIYIHTVRVQERRGILRQT